MTEEERARMQALEGKVTELQGAVEGLSPLLTECIALGEEWARLAEIAQTAMKDAPEQGGKEPCLYCKGKGCSLCP